MRTPMLALLVFSLAAVGQASFAQDQTVTIFFDGNGAESGVTPSGTTSFSFMGSNWSGGTVRTEGISSLYASGSRSYEVGSGGAMVTFDTPVITVKFFYVHSSSFPQGTATAFDSNGAMLESVSSKQASGFGNPANFVSFATTTPIQRIEFSSAVIDNFSYTIPAPPPPFVLDVSVEGSWLDPNTSGQGMLMDYFPGVNKLFVAWFTFDPAGGAKLANTSVRWVTAVLDITGDTASGDIFATTDGAFNAPMPAPVNTVVGTMSIQFAGCDAATVNFTLDPPDNVMGTISLVPLGTVVDTNFSCGGM